MGALRNPLACRQRPHLVALVRAGARFKKGKSSDDPTNQEVISKSRDTPIHRPPILLTVKRRLLWGALGVVRMP